MKVRSASGICLLGMLSACGSQDSDANNKLLHGAPQLQQPFPFNLPGSGPKNPATKFLRPKPLSGKQKDRSELSSVILGSFNSEAQFFSPRGKENSHKTSPFTYPTGGLQNEIPINSEHLRPFARELLNKLTNGGDFVTLNPGFNFFNDNGRLLIGWKSKDSSRQAGDSYGSYSTARWQLTLNSVPIESAEVVGAIIVSGNKVGQSAEQTSTEGLKSQSNPVQINKLDFAQGNVPLFLVDSREENSIDGEQNPEVHVESYGVSQAQAIERVAWQMNFHPWRFVSVEPVYLATRQKFIPAFKMYVKHEGSLPGRGPAFPLSVLVDGRTGDLLEQKVMGVHVTGTANLFKENQVVTPTQETTELPDLTNQGTKLSHPLFTVLTCKLAEPGSKCTQEADSSSSPGNFASYQFEDEEYDEVNAYYAVTRSMAWYRKILAEKPKPSTSWGADYPGPRADFGMNNSLPLKVYVRALTKIKDDAFTLDNAAYLPSALTPGSAARIVIGTGWEPGQQGEQARLLRYLGKDADVVMHEFGHHMVYRSLRDVSGQGGALHEGLADYFTYAITGNNRLGESIVSYGESLRAASKPGTLKTYINERPHRAGEFWSTVLWDIRTTLGPWKNGFFVFDKIVWEAIDLFKMNAGYYEAIAAIAKATEIFAQQEKRNATELKEKMFSKFYSRGYLQKPTGDGKLPGPSALLSTPVDEVAPETQQALAPRKEPDKAWYECGVVAGQANHFADSRATTLIILLLPLIFGLIRKKKHSSTSSRN